MRKRELNKQVFGSFVGGFGPFDNSFGLPSSPEVFNLNLTEGLSYDKYPFKVDLVGETPLISGIKAEIQSLNASFRCDFKINKGYIIDAYRLNLLSNRLAAVSLRKNGDLVVIKNGTKSILTNYLSSAIPARIGNSPMVDTSEETGPLVSLYFNFINGVLANISNNQNNPVLWFEIKHQNTLDVPVGQFAIITSANIYSVEQLAAKYNVPNWVPGAGLEDGDVFSTSYFTLFSAENYGFQFALGKTYLEQRAILGQPLPPGWDTSLPQTEYAYFNPQNAFNILYNPVVGIPGTQI